MQLLLHITINSHVTQLYIATLLCKVILCTHVGSYTVAVYKFEQ